LSPGSMTTFNENKYFSLKRLGATANYMYFRTYIDRTFFMPKNFMWVLNFSFQLSTNKLLPSEEFSLGGYYTVRGYKENEIISDNGVNIKNELRTPPVSVFFRKSKKDHLQFLAFLDYGKASNVDQDILSQHAINLASTGIGLRYSIKDNLIFRCDQGWQLIDINRLVGNSHKHCQTHIALTVSY
jgi:hemolysin activation/secretion protein